MLFPVHAIELDSSSFATYLPITKVLYVRTILQIMLPSCSFRELTGCTGMGYTLLRGAEVNPEEKKNFFLLLFSPSFCLFIYIYMCIIFKIRIANSKYHHRDPNVPYVQWPKQFCWLPVEQYWMVGLGIIPVHHFDG